MKTAIILFNLGGPDNPSAVRPFLFNLFNDPAIIRVPKLIRYLLAQLISRKRAPVATEIYNTIGGKSPILPNTMLQANALEVALGAEYKTFICMRYWHPMADEVVRAVKEYNPEKIILLPLYPQFSTTTTASSFKQWHDTAKKHNLNVQTTSVCCYPIDSSWIDAVIAKIQSADIDYSNTRLLFSAHGLPEKIVKNGDPYQWQVEQTVQAVVNKLGIADLDYIVCYQSRVGPMKWITPSTESEIKRAGQEKRKIAVIPIAFVSEHSETLVELDIEYRHLAKDAGVPEMKRIETVSHHELYIKSMADLSRQAQNSDETILAPAIKCPKQFCGCACSN